MFDIQRKKRYTYLFGAAIGLAALAGIAGCKKNAPAPIVSTTNDTATDPAAANLAPVDPNSQQVNESQTQSSTPDQQVASNQQAAPVPCTPAPAPARTRAFAPAPSATSYNQVSAPAPTEQATQPPPPLPEYQQPPAPAPNDLWTPGYWGYAPAGGYYWVPGVWVAAPRIGVLWTPPYWGFFGGHYLFHRGYWGPHIGFYGGINYGFGYVGHGYEGGYWHGNDFFYNRSVNRINEVNIHNVYNHTVIVNNYNRVSYNGGQGGVNFRPSLAEAAAMHEQHVPPVAAQVQLHQQAAQNRQQFFSQNHGHPEQAAFEHPEAARTGLNAQPENRPEINRPGAPNAMRGPQPQEQHNLQQQQHEQQLHNQQQEQQQQRNQQQREQQLQQQQEQRNLQQHKQQQQHEQQQHVQPRQERAAPQHAAPQPHQAPHQQPHPTERPHEENKR